MPAWRAIVSRCGPSRASRISRPTRSRTSAKGSASVSNSYGRLGFTSWRTGPSGPVGGRLKALCSPGRQELAAEIALHFEKGLAYDDAINSLVLAAENAAARFAYRDSIQVLRHALTLVPHAAVEHRAEL